jgi:hypothetical protein
MDPHDRDAVIPSALNDLMSDAQQRAPHVIAVEDDPFAHFAPSGLSEPG